MRSGLYEHSISVILNNQHSNGAYVASPSFAPYRYCWFRDGAFIAYAMDLVGEHESARRFHEWASGTTLRYESRSCTASRTPSEASHPKKRDASIAVSL